MRKVWTKGPRTVVTARDKSGREIVRTGKRGGPVVRQDVELRLVPKG